MRPPLPLLATFGLLWLHATAHSQVVAAVFDTPEAAIAHYLEGVARNDVDQILQTAASGEMAAGFRFDLQVERLGGMMILTDLVSPPDSPFFAELNRVQLSARILRQVTFLSMSLLGSEEIGAIPIRDVGPERVDSFLQELDPQRLATLEIARVALPDEAEMAGPRYLEHAALLAGVFGADEQTERVVLVSFEGRSFLVGFTLLRYGESWKIATQTSPLGRTEALGTAQETTPEAFEELLAGSP